MWPLSQEQHDNKRDDRDRVADNDECSNEPFPGSIVATGVACLAKRRLDNKAEAPKAQR